MPKLHVPHRSCCTEVLQLLSPVLELHPFGPSGTALLLARCRGLLVGLLPHRLSPLVPPNPLAPSPPCRYDGMRSVGPASALFFIFTIVVGNYVVLNLFIAMWVDKGDGGRGMA